WRVRARRPRAVAALADLRAASRWHQGRPPRRRAARARPARHRDHRLRSQLGPTARRCAQASDVARCGVSERAQAPESTLAAWLRTLVYVCTAWVFAFPLATPTVAVCIAIGAG